MVGEAGLEPATPGNLLSKQMVHVLEHTRPAKRRALHLSAWLGAGEGIRTLDPLLGKQGLYRSRCTST